MRISNKIDDIQSCGSFKKRFFETDTKIKGERERLSFIIEQRFEARLLLVTNELVTKHTVVEHI